MIRIGGPRPVKQKNASSSLYNRSLSITYGIVDSNNTNGTTNILLSNGFQADNIRIPSSSFPTQDPVTGGIDYPPEGAEVAIIHPEGDINSGFIITPGLNERNPDVVSALFDKGDIQILPGGWELTKDKETGRYTIKNGSTFILEANPDSETFSFTDFKGNTIKNDGTSILINNNLEVLQ